MRKTDVISRFSFDEREPEIGAYISLVWEDGSDCECTYNGLDKSILPLPRIMRIKDGSICIFYLEKEIRKIVKEKLRENVQIDIKLINNYNGFLSKYNYDIGLINENGIREACTVEGLASNWHCPELLNRLPFNL